MHFEWDPVKEKLNIKKHGISFESARQALECNIVVVLREEKALGEDRYVYLGMCKRLNILVVVTAFPEDEVIRIISARKANKVERKFYEAQL